MMGALIIWAYLFVNYLVLAGNVYIVVEQMGMHMANLVLCAGLR
jgi:hypothetical protein